MSIRGWSGNPTGVSEARHDLPTQQLERALLARTQLLVSVSIGAAAAVPVGLFASWEYAPLTGWDVTAAVYLIWVWFTIWPRDAENTASLSVYADPTRATSDLLLLASAAASLIAVGFVLARASREDNGTSAVLHIGLGLLSIALSWTVVHTIFTLRYARLYYTGEDGGVDFNQPEPPKFSDFAYLAFTLGMTFQVSDTNLTAEEFRRTAIRQALMSYLFGTGILAMAINLVASLTSK